jgi:hypothetical protein
MPEFDPNSLTEQELSFLKKAKTAGTTAEKAFAFLQEKRGAMSEQPTVEQQAKAEPRAPVPEAVEVQPDLPGPRRPVEVRPEEVQKTGKLPEGVTPEAATEAIREEAPVLKEEPIPAGKELKFAFEDLQTFIKDQPQAGKDIFGLAAGAGAGALASGTLKAIPVISKLAKAGGLTKLLTRMGIGATEAAAAQTAFSVVEEGKLPTAKDVGELAAVGAAIPVVGAIGAGAKKLLGKAIPESLVKSATRLKPNEKIKIAQKLEQMGVNETAETAEQYLIREKIAGTPKQMADDLLKKSKLARAEKLKVLKDLPNKFKDDVIEQFADETLAAVEGVAGLEKEAEKIAKIAKSIKSPQGATLSEIDELKTIFDRNLNVFTIAGDVKQAAKAKGLANLRGNAQALIEREAEKLGVANIKQLNQEVSLTRALGDAIKKQEIGAGGNALANLSDYLLGTGTLGAGIVAGGLDFENVKKSALAAAGIIVTKKLFSPAIRVKLANILSKSLKAGEAGALLNFLQGQRKNLSKPIVEKFNEAVKAAEVLPSATLVPAQ